MSTIARGPLMGTIAPAGAGKLVVRVSGRRGVGEMKWRLLAGRRKIKVGKWAVSVPMIQPIPLLSLDPPSLVHSDLCQQSIWCISYWTQRWKETNIPLPGCKETLTSERPPQAQTPLWDAAHSPLVWLHKQVGS